MTTPIAIFTHLLGLALCLASLYLSLFVTHGADMTTLLIGVAGIFIFWWPVFVEEVRK